MATPAPEDSRASRPPRERLASVKDRGGVRPRRAQRRRAPKVVQCPECQSTNIEEVDGSTVCGDCGVSINESNIVSEVAFGETAAGAAVVQGAFVGEGQRHARAAGGGGGRFGRVFSTREPREVSEANGREELRKQGTWHHLKDHIVERAFSIYKLALGSGFNQGRQTTIVAAVCLYAACRREKQSTQLLIDFAEGIAVNVFRIGQTWQELKKKLFLDDVHYRPVLEVEDLVARFIKKLEFGRDAKKVANDALLILRRMKRDWMVTGRRPNGLIGACIILAARMNNYRRTVREVVYVVKVADMTIAKRLDEFRRTPASAMTVEDFKAKALRLPQGMPPSIAEGKMREERLQKIIQENAAKQAQRESMAPSEASGMSELRESSVAIAARKKRKLTEEPRLDADGFAVPSIPIDPRLEDRETPLHRAASEFSDVAQPRSASEVDAEENGSDADNDVLGKKQKQGPTRIVAPIPLSEEELLSEQELEREMEVILNDTRNFMTADAELVTLTPMLEARVAEQLRENNALAPTSQVSDAQEVAEHEFENDPEVANCLLNPDEQKIKERIWVTHNEDWLRSQQAKMLKKALDEANGTAQKKKERKKRKNRRMGDGSLLEGTPVDNAADAARIMLERHAHNPSRHINYANVDKLYADFRDADSETTSTRAGSTVPMSEVGASSVAGSTVGVPMARMSSLAPSIAGLPTPSATQEASSTRSESRGLDSFDERRGNDNGKSKKRTMETRSVWEEEDEEDDDDEDDDDSESDSQSDEDAEEVIEGEVGDAEDPGILRGALMGKVDRGHRGASRSSEITTSITAQALTDGPARRTRNRRGNG